MNDCADLIAEDSVVVVLSGLREAAVATLLQAMKLLAAEIPATRPLQDVAADGRDVADVRRRGVSCGIGQSGITRANDFVLAQLIEGRPRPDVETGRIFTDLIQTRNRADVDQLGRRVEPFL